MIPIADADRLALTFRPPGRPVMRQSWDHLLFLHWEVPAGAVARLLPPGLEVDTFEGRAYVGLIPFAMRGVRPAGLPRVRGLSEFPETNVRTYVHAGGRDPGVWFFSLDAANPVAVAIARLWFRLPYFLARMAVDVGPTPADPGGSIGLNYRSDRRGRRPAAVRIEARARGPEAPAAAGTLDHFLIERYLLYARGRSGRLIRGRVHHPPYRIRAAEADRVEETALAAAGIDRPGSAPIAHYARGVDVEVFAPMPVTRTSD